MSGKETITPLSKVLSLPGGDGINKLYIDIIANEEIPVLCINKAADKKRLMPFKVLYDNTENFWQQDGAWEYYLTDESIEIIKGKAAVKTGTWDLERSKTEEAAQAEEADESNDYGKDYSYFAEMTTQERIEHLNKDRRRLDELFSQKTRDEDVVFGYGNGGFSSRTKGHTCRTDTTATG